MSTFEQFWPHYLREHAKPETRGLHIAGTTLSLICLFGALVSRVRREDDYWSGPLVGGRGYCRVWAGLVEPAERQPVGDLLAQPPFRADAIAGDFLTSAY